MIYTVMIMIMMTLQAFGNHLEALESIMNFIVNIDMQDPLGAITILILFYLLLFNVTID